MSVCRKYAVDVVRIVKPSQQSLNEAFGTVVTSIWPYSPSKILLLPETGFGGRGKNNFSPRAPFHFIRTRWFMLKVCVHIAFLAAYMARTCVHRRSRIPPPPPSPVPLGLLLMFTRAELPEVLPSDELFKTKGLL